MLIRAVLVAAVGASACADEPVAIEAFDATAAGYAAGTGGFVVGATDAAEGCPLVGETFAVPAGDAHQLALIVATDADPECPSATYPIWPDCGPDRTLDEQACATYRKVVGGQVVAEAVAATGSLAVSRGDGICTFGVDAVFPEKQRVTYTFSVVDRGPFPRCEVP